MKVGPTTTGVLLAGLCFLVSGCGSESENCLPGEKSCIDNAVFVCNSSGSQRLLDRDCGMDAICYNGNCIPKVIGSDVGADHAGTEVPLVDEPMPEEPDWVEAAPEPIPDDSQDIPVEIPDVPDVVDVVDAVDAVDTMDIADPGPMGEDVRPDDFDDAPGLPDEWDVPEPVDTADPEDVPEVQDVPGIPDDPGMADLAEPDLAEPDLAEPDPAEVVDDPGQEDPGSPEDVGPLEPCGNGSIDPGEQCDGTNLAGKSCSQLLYAPGILACKPDCTWDTLLCGESSHRFTYNAVPNIWVKGDFVDVAWHPSGDYAVIIGYSGDVVRYDPGVPPIDSITAIGTTTGMAPKRVDFAPSGHAYIVGYDAEGNGRIFKVPDGGQSVFELEGAGQKARFLSIKFTPDGSFALIAGQSSNYTINYVCTFDPETETTSDYKGYSASAGVNDFMWVPGYDAFEGILGALLVHGYNGKDAHIWLDINKEINPANSGTASFGNMGRCAYRPGSHYGLVAGTSSNVLYIYEGNVNLPSWDKAYLSDFGSGVLDVAFRPDGGRAVLLGRPWGNPLTLHIQEHRPKGDAFDENDFIIQDLPDWDSSPWFATSSTFLVAAAFRPGAKCDEGLMVGDHPGTMSAPTYGTVVHFKDTDILDCL